MDMNEFAALIRRERESLLSAWRIQVRELPSAQHLDIPTLNDHIPGLLDELATAFASGVTQTIPDGLAEGSAPVHGLQRLEDAFDIEEVVAEYNILRGCLHDLATQHGYNLQGVPFHVLNQIFDHAIGLALKTYSAQRALEVRQRREEYLAFVAHDLQTPLFAISLAGRVMEKILPEQGYGPESAVMLVTLSRSVRQLEGLVRKVLDENTSVEAEAGIKIVRREFDLWPLVEGLQRDLLGIAAESGTRLTNKMPHDLVVYADAALLRRVLQNLIANAIRYTPGGKVVVEASRQEADDGFFVECRVRDDGAGIPADLLADIFEKGEGDASVPESKGLGLAIVRQFTEAHGGTVTVESREGEGALFRLRLPLKA
jgi:two-component system phosphate regulon sensor histidine kinase PhoR